MLHNTIAHARTQYSVRCTLCIAQKRKSISLIGKMQQGITVRADGILVIIRAENCAVCRQLTDDGIFAEIEGCDLGQAGGICPIDMKFMGPIEDADSNLVKVFNLARTFPRFMYMFPRTFERAKLSGADYTSVVHDIRFFCAQYDTATQTLVRTPDMLVTPRNIQVFCDQSMNSLLNSAVVHRTTALQSRTIRRGYY